MEVEVAVHWGQVPVELHVVQLALLVAAPLEVEVEVEVLAVEHRMEREVAPTPMVSVSECLAAAMVQMEALLVEFAVELARLLLPATALGLCCGVFSN